MDYYEAEKKLSHKGQLEGFDCDDGEGCSGVIGLCRECGQYWSVCGCGFRTGLCDCMELASPDVEVTNAPY